MSAHLQSYNYITSWLGHLGMAREGTVYGVVILGIIIGLSSLLYGEAIEGGELLVYGGGAIVLASIGLLTIRIATLE